MDTKTKARVYRCRACNLHARITRGEGVIPTWRYTVRVDGARVAGGIITGYFPVVLNAVESWHEVCWDALVEVTEP